MEFPLLALLVSGGHTRDWSMSEAGDYKIVGKLGMMRLVKTYDKVGRVMGLTYPGPEVGKSWPIKVRIL